MAKGIKLRSKNSIRCYKPRRQKKKDNFSLGKTQFYSPKVSELTSVLISLDQTKQASKEWTFDRNPMITIIQIKNQ